MVTAIDPSGAVPENRDQSGSRLQLGGETAATGCAVLDLSVLTALVGEDAVVIDDLLNEFRNSSAALAIEIERACSGRLSQSVAAAAHKLKSSARSIGAARLGDLCEALELFGRADDLAALDDTLPHFRSELAALQATLNARNGISDPKSICA